jgi:hypothetical protein
VDVRRAYCSAVDRNVPVRLRAGASPRDRVSLQDPAELVCLDYGVRCTGWCCPLFSISDDDGVSAAASTERRRAPTSASSLPSRASRA